MWFSVVCTLIGNDTFHHSGQNLLWTHWVVSPQYFDHCDDAHCCQLNTTTDHAKPHSIFFTTILRITKEIFATISWQLKTLTQTWIMCMRCIYMRMTQRHECQQKTQNLIKGLKQLKHCWHLNYVNPNLSEYNSVEVGRCTFKPHKTTVACIASIPVLF